MKILVTGGGGFLGKALCRALIQAGHEVRSLSRNLYTELEALGVEQRQADISKALDEHYDFFKEVDAIFHTAARVGMWGQYPDFYCTNVLGTRNLLKACKQNSISRFIFTSSPSVIADGTDLEGVDESYTYPTSHLAHYPKTKARAEREVLEANSKALRTIALRPHLIFGPGDTNLIPTVIERAREGKLVQVGDGKNLCDFSYIDDCVAAHICALSACDENPAACGRAYFISQGDPMSLWSWIAAVLRANDLTPPRRTVSYGKAYALAALMEIPYKLFPFLGEPRLSRFLVTQMAHHHYFDISAAEKELGYLPSVSVEEGLRKTFSNETVEPARVSNL